VRDVAVQLLDHGHLDVPVPLQHHLHEEGTMGANEEMCIINV